MSYMDFGGGSSNSRIASYNPYASELDASHLSNVLSNTTTIPSRNTANQPSYQPSYYSANNSTLYNNYPQTYQNKRYPQTNNTFNVATPPNNQWGSNVNSPINQRLQPCQMKANVNQTRNRAYANPWNTPESPTNLNTVSSDVCTVMRQPSAPQITVIRTEKCGSAVSKYDRKSDDTIDDQSTSDFAKNAESMAKNALCIAKYTVPIWSSESIQQCLTNFRRDTMGGYTISIRHWIATALKECKDYTFSYGDIPNCKLIVLDESGSYKIEIETKDYRARFPRKGRLFIVNYAEVIEQQNGKIMRGRIWEKVKGGLLVILRWAAEYLASEASGMVGPYVGAAIGGCIGGPAGAAVGAGIEIAAEHIIQWGVDKALERIEPPPKQSPHMIQISCVCGKEKFYSNKTKRNNAIYCNNCVAKYSV